MIITAIGIALQSIRKNKLRTSLTLFGITVGIAMVIIVMSAGSGVKGLIVGQLASFGDNWINIEVKIPEAKANSSENTSALSQGVTITTLTYDDAVAIQKIPSITTAYAGLTSQAVVSYQAEKIRPMIFGVTAEYPRIDTTPVALGRFFTQPEERSAEQIVVLGNDIKEKLFGNDDPIGKHVSLNGKNYEVIGVMSERGVAGFMNMDELIYLPLRTVQKKLMAIDHVLWIIAQTKEAENSKATAEEITELMRERHAITNPDKDDFSVTTMEESLALVSTVLIGITGLLIALVCISLVVGGVGIMNIMYVSVVERTFEIGLRKATGATTKHILWQFLIEALIITLLGGIIGIIIGISFSFLMSVIASAIGLDWTFEIPFTSLLLSLFFSTAVGLLFGIYPAKQASKLDPIEAIRQE